MDDAVEGKVRPAVTVLLVVAQIALAYLWAVGGSDAAKDAFAGLMPLTSMALLFYFKSREERQAQASTAAAVAAATGGLPPSNGNGGRGVPPAGSAPVTAGGSGAHGDGDAVAPA